MKNSIVSFLFSFPIVIATACDQGTPTRASSDQNPITENTNAMRDTLIIKVGNKNFTATLLDNPTTTAFKSMLPLTINMTELNGNEKYVDLPESFPTNASNPGTINTGDLLLYGSKTLVLFYKTFSTSYSYTKLGKIDNPSGLAEALGSGNVAVTIELK
jgi:hypothetical protein